MNKNLLQTALISLIGSIVACSVFFLFLSIFMFNIQIQHMDSKGYLKDYTSIIQIDELYSNLHAYFFEDCPFVCIPNKY